MRNYAGYLNIFGTTLNLRNGIDLRFIYVPVGEMLQQVFEGKNLQLLFQQVGPLRAYAFQVFNRAL